MPAEGSVKPQVDTTDVVKWTSHLVQCISGADLVVLIVSLFKGKCGDGVLATYCRMIDMSTFK